MYYKPHPPIQQPKKEKARKWPMRRVGESGWLIYYPVPRRRDHLLSSMQMRNSATCNLWEYRVFITSMLSQQCPCSLMHFEHLASNVQLSTSEHDADCDCMIPRKQSSSSNNVDDVWYSDSSIASHPTTHCRVVPMTLTTSPSSVHAQSSLCPHAHLWSPSTTDL